MKMKNIILGILVVALITLLIGGASAAVPVAVDSKVTATEDTTYTFTADDFDFTDYDGDILENITVEALSAKGTLKFEGATFTVPKDVTKAELDAGKLTFSPVANENGNDYTTFTFNVTAGGEKSGIAATMTIDVTAVNDAPTFTTYDFASKELKEELLYEGYTLTATDPDTNDTPPDTLTFTSTTLPTGLTLTSTGVLSGTPADGTEGVYTATLTVTDNALTSLKDTKTIKYYVKDKDDTGKLTIDDVNFEDLTGTDDKHYPGDIIEVEVDLTNELLDDNIEDVTIYIKSTSLDIDEERDISQIDSDDSLTETIQFKIPYDAEDKTYDFEITAKGRDDSDNRTYHFARYFETSLIDKTLSIRRSNHDIIISYLTVDKEEVEAGETVTITAEIVNIGRKDENNAKVTIKNTALGINEASTEYDLKTDKDKKFTFDVTIPEDAESKTYDIEAVISYDDDADDEDDSPLAKTIELKVTGGQVIITTAPSTTTTAVTTTATTTIGKAAKYELTLTNNEATTQTYEIRVSGANDWATYLIEAGGETNTVSLNAGGSLPIYVYLTPITGTKAGTYTATISAYSGTNLASSIVLTTTVTSTSSITGSGVFVPSDVTVSWIVIGIVAMFGIAVAGYTIYSIKKE